MLLFYEIRNIQVNSSERDAGMDPMGTFVGVFE